MDSEQLKILTDEIARLRTSLEQGIVEGARDGVRKASDSWAKMVEGAGDVAVDVTRTWGEAAEDAVRQLRGGLSDTQKEQLTLIEKQTEEYREQARLRDRIQKSFLNQARLTGKDLDERAGRGRDGAGGMFEGLRTLNSTILSGLPFGGILGVMMFGRLQESEYAAKAQQAGQVMQNSGRVGRGVIRQLNSDLRTLEQSIPGIGANFQAAGAALASMGFTATDAGQAISQNLASAKDTVMNLTVAMDRFFEIGQGEAMKLSATIATNTNGSLKQSAELVRDIGLSVQNTGMSFSQMLGSVMQVTSALRLQTNELQEAKDVAEVIRDAQAGFQVEGFSAQGAAQAAVAGLQGVAGALQGLDTGMKAYLGSQMTGEGPSLSTFRRFEEGFRGENRSFFKDSIEALLTTSREMGGGDEDRQYLALRTAFNLSAEQAQTLMAIQQDAGEQKSISKAAEEHMDALNSAFKDEGLKQSTFKTLTNQLIQVVARVGSALLDVLVSGLEMLTASLTYLGSYLTIGTTQQQDAAYIQYIMASSKQAEKGMANAVSVMQDIPKLLGQGGQMVLGRSARTQRASKDFYKASVDTEGERRNAVQDLRDAFNPFSSSRPKSPAPNTGGASGSWELGLRTPKDFKPGDRLEATLRRVGGSTAEGGMA